LPVKIVIFNNSGYGLITLEAEGIDDLPAYRKGIGFPNPDAATLTRAREGHEFTVQNQNRVKGAVSAAFAIEGPAIIDAVVASNELPKLSHLEVDAAGHVAVAKLKEGTSRPNRRVITTRSLPTFAVTEPRAFATVSIGRA
jgi:pyruvate dehydrogenase (quinone)